MHSQEMQAISFFILPPLNNLSKSTVLSLGIVKFLGQPFALTRSCKVSSYSLVVERKDFHLLHLG
jgi:hypothetical protein